MTDINQLFFELIRVAIGTQNTLSRAPSAKEWKALYEMALKQSLLGVCFAGVQKVVDSGKENYCGMPEMLYLTWMGTAAQIQQRNEVMNRRCVELQAKLLADGLQTSILKGQGVGALYGDKLSFLRQSGDIDIWVQGGMKKTMSYISHRYGKVKFDYINAHVPIYSDTEVEMHWRAQALTNLFANRRLQKWLECPKSVEMILGGKARLGTNDEVSIITTPSAEFNAFYILLHCYHHMFESGLGLRQLMDLYFVLKNRSNEDDSLLCLIKQFGMMRFATAVMWIMQDVFGLEEKFMICKPNEMEGLFILNEIMHNGNFGHHDERKHHIRNKWVAPFATRIQHNWHLATHYPSEFLWAPVWLAFHYIWKRTKKDIITKK